MLKKQPKITLNDNTESQNFVNTSYACILFVYSSTVSNSLDHLWHRDFTVFLEGVHHQTIAADVVNALLRKGKQRKGVTIHCFCSWWSEATMCSCFNHCDGHVLSYSRCRFDVSVLAFSKYQIFALNWYTNSSSSNKTLPGWCRLSTPISPDGMKPPGWPCKAGHLWAPPSLWSPGAPCPGRSAPLWLQGTNSTNLHFTMAGEKLIHREKRPEWKRAKKKNWGDKCNFEPHL